MQHLFSIFAVIILTAQAAENEPGGARLTSEEAVAIALARNRDLAAARFLIRQAQGRLAQAGLWPNPEFDLARRTDAPFGNEGEFAISSGFSQRFPISGRLAKAKALARVDVALAQAEIRDRERLLAGEVRGRSRVLQVLREKLRTNQDLQGALQRFITVLQKRLALGEISAADVNLAKLELQKLTLAEIALFSQKETTTQMLNHLLGRDPQTPLEIAGVIDTELDLKRLAEGTRQAVGLRPDYRLAAMAVDRAAAELRLARAQRWEDWNVGVEFNRERSIFSEPVRLDERDNFLGFRLSIPLPLFNRNQGRIREVRAVQERVGAELGALELRIATEAQTAENRIRRFLAILRQYRQESIKLARNNLGLLQKGYAQGLVGMTAVIQAQQQYASLRQAYWDAVGAFLGALTDWETATASFSFSKIH